MILIPSQDKKIIQANNGNISGNVWSSFNLDFASNRGRIRTTRMLKNISISGNIQSSLPVGFRYFGDWWALCGSDVYSSPNLQTAFSLYAGVTSNDPHNQCSSATSDIELFNSKLYVSGDSSVFDYNGSAWTRRQNGSLTGNSPHLLCVYGDRLYITDTLSKIYSIDTSDVLTTSGSSSLSFVDYNINTLTFLRSSSNRIWIGTVNIRGGKGHIYEWDGVSTQATRSYRLESSGALACVIKDDTPYIMETDGRLTVWNGSSFKEIARLPLIDNQLLYNATNTANNFRFIHPNGMTVVNGKINILINGTNEDYTSTQNENLPSGVWEYDENIGLYHKYSASYTPIGTTTVTDYGQNRVSAVGGLSSAKVENSSSDGANGTLLAGIRLFTDSSTESSGIFINDTLDTAQKYSYFVTTWIDSPNLKDSWNNYYLKFKQFLDSSDKIIVKYRTLETTSQEVSITWTSTSTFTTSTSILGKEGYEIEVLQGTGSGKTAHITSIDWNNTVYTAHLDDTFTGVTTGTAKVRIQKWTKLNEITGQTMESFKGSINKISERIQLKVCMQFTGKDELHQLIIVNNSHSKLE